MASRLDEVAAWEQKVDQMLRENNQVVAAAKRINPIVAIPKERKKRGRIGS